MATNLSLRIHSVKCVDETGGSWAERVGNDEIYLGGFIIDAAGITKKVSPMSIYPHFDDGDIKKFNPPRVFASFQLTGSNWPRNCIAGFLLFEKDSGDMSSATQKIYEKVVEEMERRKQQMIAARAGRHILVGEDPTHPTPQDPSWGDILWTTAKEIVYNYVKTKITAGLADELFPLQEAAVTLLSANHTWNGSNASPVSMVEFRAHEGVYQLFFDWELS